MQLRNRGQAPFKQNKALSDAISDFSNQTEDEVIYFPDQSNEIIQLSDLPKELIEKIASILLEQVRGRSAFESVCDIRSLSLVNKKVYDDLNEIFNLHQSDLKIFIENKKRIEQWDPAICKKTLAAFLFLMIEEIGAIKFFQDNSMAITGNRILIAIMAFAVVMTFAFFQAEPILFKLIGLGDVEGELKLKVAALQDSFQRPSLKLPSVASSSVFSAPIVSAQENDLEKQSGLRN